MRLGGSIRCAASSAALALLVSCAGAPAESPSVEAVVEVSDRVDASWVEATWQVQVGAPDDLKPFQDVEGWTDLVVRRDLKGAVEGLAQTGGLPLARAHAEAASLYRQSAMLAAWSLIQTYDETGKETDPAGVAHLLAVSHAVVGDLDKARAFAAAQALNADSPAAAWHSPWAAWLQQEAPEWPPPLDDVPAALAEVSPGTWPEIATPPHYTLVERTPEKREIATGDPAVLIIAALWHESAARQAAGEQSAFVDQYGARYRLPIEKGSLETTEMDAPMAFLFGADFAHPGDAAFVAALVGDSGTEAVEAFQDRSLLARLAADILTPEGVDVERAEDLASALRRALLVKMAERAGGVAQDYHRPFADVGRVGALRVFGLIAEVAGDREAAGRLWISASELSRNASACPVALLSLGAWDARNRYPHRAQTILHNQIKRYPSLEVARFGLDRLALRVGLERSSPDPGM